MKDLKGTKTLENLKEAFAGESMARNKYSYFASKAKKDGYEQISQIFNETAENEKAHAKIWYKYIIGGEINDTMKNLASAAADEHFENTQMYARMAKEAKAEGFTEIQEKFEKVGAIEKLHENRYLALLKNMKDDSVFKKDHKTKWLCLECGRIVESDTAPLICEVCSHPQAYQKLDVKDY